MFTAQHMLHISFSQVSFIELSLTAITDHTYEHYTLKVEKGDVLDHFPGLLILKFIFAFGWLEVFFHKNAYPGTKRRKLLSSRLRRRSKVHGDQILMTSRWFFILDRFLLTKRSDILNSKNYIQILQCFYSRCATWLSGIFGRWEKTSTSGKDHLRRRRGRTRRTRRTMRRRLRRRGEWSSIARRRLPNTQSSFRKQTLPLSANAIEH